MTDKAGNYVLTKVLVKTGDITNEDVSPVTKEGIVFGEEKVEEAKKAVAARQRRRGVISSSLFSSCLILLDDASSSLVQSAALHSPRRRSLASASLVSVAMAPRQGQRTMDAYGTARRRAGPTSIAGDAAALMGKVRSYGARLVSLLSSSHSFRSRGGVETFISAG